MATTEQVAALRLLIDEPDSSTYSDIILASVIDQAENDLDLAAASIWEQKAGAASTLVDVSESGTSRSMSQVYKNAKTQAEYYAKKVADAKVVETTVVRSTRTRRAVRR